MSSNTAIVLAIIIMIVIVITFIALGLAIKVKETDNILIRFIKLFFKVLLIGLPVLFILIAIF